MSKSKTSAIESLRFEPEFNILSASFSLALSPEYTSLLIQGKVKDLARHLRKAFGLKQTKALEVVVGALGFPSWYEFLRHISAAKTDHRGVAPDEWRGRLKLALFLIVEIDVETVIPREYLLRMERLADAIAKKTGLASEMVLDRCCSRLLGGEDWASVQSRDPLRSAQPMYRFIDDQKLGSGRFVPSRPCETIHRALAWARKDFADSTAESDLQLMWANAILERQPDMLRAGLLAASMLYEQGDPSAEQVAESFLAMADQLIPKEFEGRIMVELPDNGMYHALLNLNMKIQFQLDGRRHLIRAKELALRQLRLDDTDPNKVRMVLPLIYLRLGELDKALDAANRLEDRFGLGLVVKAFCAHEAGDVHHFVQLMVRALYQVPMLEAVLAFDLSSVTEADGYREYKPDIDTFATYILPTLMERPAIEDLCQQFFLHPRYTENQVLLSSLWNKPRGTPEEDRARLRAYHETQERASVHVGIDLYEMIQGKV